MARLRLKRPRLPRILDEKDRRTLAQMVLGGVLISTGVLWLAALLGLAFRVLLFAAVGGL